MPGLYITSVVRKPFCCKMASEWFTVWSVTHSQLINSIDILRARRATGLMTRDNYRTVNNITRGKHPGAKQ
ncbi:hypothetical protein KU15F67_44870 [Escherichia coli]|nr:hypothetical protein C3456_15810 [Escherichia coli]